MPPLMNLNLGAIERVILVTGATDGIGAETALTLARDPKHTVIVHGRSEAKAQKTAKAIMDQTGNRRVETVAADFADLREVQGMATELQERFPSIHSLVCNAGVLVADKKLTNDGFESTMGVNYLSHFLLTSLMLEHIKASGTEEHKARIVAVSSICHSWEEMDFEDFMCERKGYEMYEQYSRSKLANMMHIYALNRRLTAEGAPVMANVLEPGVVETKLLRVGGYSGSPVSSGARAPVYLASHAREEGVTGKYFSCNCEPIREAPMALVEADQERLWTLSNELCSSVLGSFPALA